MAKKISTTLQTIFACLGATASLYTMEQTAFNLFREEIKKQNMQNIRLKKSSQKTNTLLSIHKKIKKTKRYDTIDDQLVAKPLALITPQKMMIRQNFELFSEAAQKGDYAEASLYTEKLTKQNVYPIIRLKTLISVANFYQEACQEKNAIKLYMKILEAKDSSIAIKRLKLDAAKATLELLGLTANTLQEIGDLYIEAKANPSNEEISLHIKDLLRAEAMLKEINYSYLADYLDLEEWPFAWANLNKAGLEDKKIEQLACIDKLKKHMLALL